MNDLKVWTALLAVLCLISIPTAWIAMKQNHEARTAAMLAKQSLEKGDADRAQKYLLELLP